MYTIEQLGELAVIKIDDRIVSFSEISPWIEFEEIEEYFYELLHGI